MKINLKRFALIFTFFTIIYFPNKNSSAQIPSKQWDKTFGGNLGSALRDLQQISSGGYILGGFTDSGISGDKTQTCRGNYDYWVVKTDSFGNKVWDKTLGGNADDYFKKVIQTSDGGFLLLGESGSIVSGDKTAINRSINFVKSSDLWLIKLDANGNKQWDKTFGGEGLERADILIQTSDNGFMIGGFSNSGISGNKSEINKGDHDFWIVKLNSLGNKVWDKTYGGAGQDDLRDLIEVPGGYILGGNSWSGIAGDRTVANRGLSDYWVIRINSTGTKIWDKAFGGNEHDHLQEISLTADNHILLGGYSYSNISGDKSVATNGTSDFWIIKIDNSGNKIWDKCFGGNKVEMFRTLNSTPDGGFILGGLSNSDISGHKSEASKANSSDYWFLKINLAGVKVWDKTIGGNQEDQLMALSLNSNGDMVAGGWSFSGISGDKTGAVKGNFDYWIVKLSSVITGVSEETAKLNLLISPNPSFGNFNIQLSGVLENSISISISDLTGRIVLEKKLSVSGRQINEVITIPNRKGIYVAKIEAGNRLYTQKLLIE